MKPGFRIDFMDERRLGWVDADVDSEVMVLFGSISAAEKERFRDGER